MFRNSLALNRINVLVTVATVAFLGGQTLVNAEESFSNLTLKKTYLNVDTQIVPLDGTVKAAFSPTVISCPGAGTGECKLHLQFSGAYENVTWLNGAVFVDGVQDVDSTLLIQTTDVQYDLHSWSAVIRGLAPGAHTIEVVMLSTGGYLRNRTLRIDVFK
jgi:hypothetical protein